MAGHATAGTRASDESTSTSKLFTDPTSHEPLAFHLHSALPSKLKAELVHLIKSHGGKIHKRLIDLHRPFYALINPDSDQVPQYAAYVSSRPEGERGTVVPYSFVRASIAAREILRPADFQSDRPTNHEDSRAWATLAFTRGSRRRASAVDKSNLGSSTVDQATTEDDGWGGLEPVTVHLHPSILRNQRRSLAVKISKAGGDPGSSIAQARVIVVHEDHAEFSRLRKQYEHSLRTYVEPVSWVARCLTKGRYFHDPIEKTPRSGRKPGADRNDFTTEDDNNLARFIAKRIPDKIDGGRTGNNLYKDLCERTDIYPWAAGHTWQSWRNRYRKKQDYFDPIVDKFVASRQDNGDGKGEFQYSRVKKRPAPAESAHTDSRSSSVLSIEESAERDPVAPRGKRPRTFNETAPASTAVRDRDRPSNMNDRRISASTSAISTGSKARRPQESNDSTPNAQKGITDSRQREKETTRRSGGVKSHERQPEISRRTGIQSRRDGVPTSSSSRARPPAEVTETTSRMGMEVNMNPLMSNPVSEDTQSSGLGTADVYGYESDHDFHAKAKDLGLSDYLESGFTSTW